MSSDFGVSLLDAVDRRIGIIDRLTQAIKDTRDPRYITHSLRDLLKQRIFQIAMGYEDGNDANSLRTDPMFKLATGRAPLNDDKHLASGSTHSRLEGSLSSCDIYRIAKALVEQFVAGYSTPPASITLDMDHSADETHGQQELALYHHHYGCHCFLPLMIFEGHSGALVTAVLRPGKRPTGKENASILKRVLHFLRHHWPDTHILVRGDGHFSNPELMSLIDGMDNVDFIFGLPGNKVLTSKAEGLMKNSRAHLAFRQSLAALKLGPAVASVQLFGEFEHAASTWSREYRVVLKAEVLAAHNGRPAKDNQRYVVTSLRNHSAAVIYQNEYCGRGQAENFIKHLKCDLKSDRTSASSFLANFARLLFAAAAYTIHQQLRVLALQDTELENAQPKTVIQSLFKIAVRVKQYKDRVLLQLPSSCPVKELLTTVCQRLCPEKRQATMLASP